MQRADYGVTCARSALQALDRVRAQPQRFEIVVTDYNMPEMSGIALAEALALAAPGLPVVSASGYVTDELKAQAHTAGLRAVLFKEYVFERMGGVVRAILDSRPAAAVPLR